MTPMKRISISLPDRLFQEAEGLAARMRVSRSELYANALKEFLKAHQADPVTEAINRVCEQLDQTPDPFLEAAHRATFLRDPW